MTARYAIYFAPSPASLLWQLGCSWLGRDPSGGALPAPALPGGLARERYEEMVSSPRLYGFHATLKPPFAPAANAGESDLRARVTELAKRWRPFVAPALQVSRIGGFLALTLSGRSTAMQDLADTLVADLDRLRAPPTAAELSARRKPSLSPRQKAMLTRWGYPYVFEEWQFHMTLTCSLGEPELSLLEGHLHNWFRPVLAAPVFVDRIALFAQPAREAPFRIAAWFPLGG